MNDLDLLINRIAQGRLPLKEGTDWFDGVDREERKSALERLSYVLNQAHPTSDEIRRGIRESGLRETAPPCVLMERNRPKTACAKILALPEGEWRAAFILWLKIFSLADDRRRRTECGEGCNHLWHNLD